MINWDEVEVGVTEIMSPSNNRVLVLGFTDEEVCVPAPYGCSFSRVLRIEEISDWTIYDPWEDVSHECRFDDEFCVYHRHHMLIEDDTITGRYKRDETGLRVWKRKEG